MTNANNKRYEINERPSKEKRKENREKKGNAVLSSGIYDGPYMVRNAVAL